MYKVAPGDLINRRPLIGCLPDWLPLAELDFTFHHHHCPFVYSFNN